MNEKAGRMTGLFILGSGDGGSEAIPMLLNAWVLSSAARSHQPLHLRCRMNTCRSELAREPPNT
ncbi:hypothetical protein ACYCAX_25045, partial [Pseudomonas sp. MT3]